MRLRKLHRIVGVTFAPFFLITSLTGIILLWRKDGLYDKEVKNLLISLHNWEIGAKYIGIILAMGLLFMTVSGLILFIRTLKR